MVEAIQSYRERMKAARAQASAQRRAEQAARQRQIELRCEVHRLALAAVKAGIQAKGQRKLSTYSRAELTMMANALIAPWFIETKRESLSRKGFRCAKLMNEMEWRNDRRLRSRQHRWPVARCSTLSADGCGCGEGVR
jgi:hypothetical protein